jgi:hypothetical protein
MQVSSPAEQQKVDADFKLAADPSTGLSALLTAITLSFAPSQLILQLLLLRGASIYAGKGRDAQEAALHANNAAAVELLDKWEAQGPAAWNGACRLGEVEVQQAAGFCRFAKSDAKKLLEMSAADAAKWLESQPQTTTANAEPSSAELASSDHTAQSSPPEAPSLLSSNFVPPIQGPAVPQIPRQALSA